ncbi:putative calcium-binding protein CML17 [Platanthera zijinensis]|uniref:Calcium-binding protein CML17 n=1 Tax=Platanthera zijinensis TaxID=2320716 RepID=A0AAP0B4L6_9ASPA
MKLVKTQIHSIFSNLSKSKNRTRARSPLPEPPAASRSSSSDESIAPKSVLRRTPSPPASVADLFNLFDGDGDGKITKPELEAVLRRLGHRDPPTDEELSLMVAEIDRDGDGCISLDELSIISAAALGPPVHGEELREAFAVFDVDGDGMISAEELLGAFVALGDGGCSIEDCRTMIGGVDSDGDGLVGFADFARMMDKTEMTVRP